MTNKIMIDQQELLRIKAFALAHESAYPHIVRAHRVIALSPMIHTNKHVIEALCDEVEDLRKATLKLTIENLSLKG